MNYHKKTLMEHLDKDVKPKRILALDGDFRKGLDRICQLLLRDINRVRFLYWI